METTTEQAAQPRDQDVIQWLEQFPAEVLEAALLILRERQSNPQQ